MTNTKDECDSHNFDQTGHDSTTMYFKCTNCPATATQPLAVMVDAMEAVSKAGGTSFSFRQKRK